MDDKQCSDVTAETEQALNEAFAAIRTQVQAGAHEEARARPVTWARFWRSFLAAACLALHACHRRG